MAEPEDERGARRHSVGRGDQRSGFERDRDRILYSSAFRRLAGITQIVRAGEADVFHTRQQHTLKVAQVGRRLAQLCLERQCEQSRSYGLDVEVVEAACLAHDLGHPPFGHVGEHLLHTLVQRWGDDDGFEGNAQTFRILTKLAVRFEECEGLDLCRATLAACIKYPWFRDPSKAERSIKWGAYKLDADDFHFAREEFGSDTAKSVEAELMDWADDIAYSVHDLEDFHRCGAIPWHRILEGGDQAEWILRRAVGAWFGAPLDAMGRLRQALKSLSDYLCGIVLELISEPYDGSRGQRQQLRLLTSSLIGRYIGALTLVDPSIRAPGQSRVTIQKAASDEVRVLKQITKDYIINNPSLAAQQKGQIRILRHLFILLAKDGRSGRPDYLPRRLHYLWDGKVSPARFAADCISSLTEAEAVGLHARLLGWSSGSVLDPIVR